MGTDTQVTFPVTASQSGSRLRGSVATTGVTPPHPIWMCEANIFLAVKALLVTNWYQFRYKKWLKKNLKYWLNELERAEKFNSLEK